MLDLLRRPSPKCAQTCKKLRELERLHEIVVRTRIQSRYAILYGVARRQHENGTVIAVLAQTRTRVHTTLAGHHPIKDENIVLRIRRVLINIVPVCDPFYRNVVLFQHILDQLSETQIVFGKQHPHNIILRHISNIMYTATKVYGNDVKDS